MYGDCLNDNDAQLLKDCIFSYVSQQAKLNNKKKIRCDVHNNLKNYNADVKQFGYEITDERAEDNPFWLKTFKTI
jgi:hypothetical protein